MAETRPSNGERTKRIEARICALERDAREHASYIDGQRALAEVFHDWREGTDKRMSRLDKRLSEIVTAIAVSKVVQAGMIAAFSMIGGGLVAFFLRAKG